MWNTDLKMLIFALDKHVSGWFSVNFHYDIDKTIPDNMNAIFTSNHFGASLFLLSLEVGDTIEKEGSLVALS